MTRNQLIAYWRGIDQRHSPLRVGDDSPRHRLVQQARLRVRALDPEVKVWTWKVDRRETGLYLCQRQRCRLGPTRASVVLL